MSPLTAGQPLTDLVRLANTGTTPNVFVATLVAQRASKLMLPGTSTEFWTYNSMVPGPLIDVFEGDAVRIRLENQLSQETTVHWHGLPVPPDSGWQTRWNQITPGASRTYEFTLPVGSAGTYWYHPHPHEFTAEQVFRGMAGLLIVRSRTDPVPTAIEEKLLVISDLRLAADGTIPADTRRWTGRTDVKVTTCWSTASTNLCSAINPRPESTLADPECDPTPAYLRLAH